MEEKSKNFKILEKIKQIKFSKKLQWLFVALFIVIIICICFTSFKAESSSPISREKVDEKNSLYLSYVNETQQRLESVLSSVKGISNVKVFINISQSPKITYLSEVKNSSSESLNGTISNTIVLAKDGTLTYPIVVLEELPEILGVLIVASGEVDAGVKLQIANIISSVLKVDVASVEVLEGK